jgi:hypothetical protein
MIEQNEVTEFNLTPELRCASILIDPCVIAVHHIYFGMLLEYAGHVIEAAGTIAVIGVQPSDDVSPCLRKAFVKRMTLPMVRL